MKQFVLYLTLLICCSSPLQAFDLAVRRGNERLGFSLFPFDDLHLYPSRGKLGDALYIDAFSSIFYVRGYCFAGISPLPLSFLTLEAPLSCRLSFGEHLVLAPSIAPEIRYDNHLRKTTAGVNAGISASFALPGTQQRWQLSGKVQYKLADSRREELPSKVTYDAGALQFFNDLLSTYGSLGVVYYPGQAGQGRGWLLEYYSTLPETLRRTGNLAESQGLRLQWLRLVHRWQVENFIWGLGIGYGKAELDPLVFQGIIPSVVFAYKI